MGIGEDYAKAAHIQLLALHAIAKTLNAEVYFESSLQES